MSRRTLSRTATSIDVSIAVPQTSPSPWAAWVSPSENSAPSTPTGRYSVVPGPRYLTSMLPPQRDGGTTGWDDAVAEVHLAARRIDA